VASRRSRELQREEDLFFQASEAAIVMWPWVALAAGLVALFWRPRASFAMTGERVTFTPGGEPISFSGGSMSDGRELAKALPPKAGNAREQAILELAEAGEILPPELVAMTYAKGGHTVEMFPAKDALMLGTVNPVRLNARHTTAQGLADFFGMVLPTSLMSDMAWLASTEIGPEDGHSGPAMADTATMVLHSDLVDVRIAKVDTSASGGLVRPVGKDWVNTERLLQQDGSVTRAKEDPSSPAAANFGWQKRGAGSKSPGGQPVLQPVGLVHSTQHTDYSQVVTLYGPTVIIDGGSPELIADVLRDPARAFLLSDEVKEGQAARVTRHPSVPLAVA